MLSEDFLVDALAVFRITRLATTDTFPPVRKAREWVWARWPPVGQYLDDDWKRSGQDRAFRWWKLLGVDVCTEVTVTAHGTQAVVTEAHPVGEFVGCPHCVGVWCAAAVVLVRHLAPRWWDPVARVAATAAVTSIIASHT